MSKQTFRHTHSPPGASLSQTQELPPNVMELWVYLAHGSPYFLILKWKEWEKSEQCLYRKKKNKKKRLPGALLWDYENWPRVRISREGWRGAVLLLVFFPPLLAGSVLYWAGLCWVGSGFLLPVPRTQGPFFLLPITTRCAQACFKNSDPSLSHASSSEQLVRVTTHTEKNLVEKERKKHTLGDRHAHKHGLAAAL